MEGTTRKPLFSRKRTAVVLLVILGILLLLHVASSVQLFDEDRSLLVLSRTQAEAESLKTSPELQLVGYVTCRHQYGLLNPKRQSVGSAEAGCTVLCRSGQYYVVHYMLEIYLRSLLRKEDYPLLAKDDAELHKLKAVSDSQALQEAADGLVRNMEW